MKLPANTRSRINTILSGNPGLNGNRSWAKVQQGYVAALEILEPFGIVLNDTVTTWEFEKAMTSRTHIRLAFQDGTPIENSLLVISWAPFGDYPTNDRTMTRFEVIAYLS